MPGLTLRRQGIRGVDAPTKEKKTVKPADFSVAGLIGRFERSYDKAFSIEDTTEMVEIFGNNISSSWYGWDVAQRFLDNLRGVDGELYIKPYVGNDGSAIDAVVASRSVSDQSNPAINFRSGYKALFKDGAFQYGSAGNRTGVKITEVVRASTGFAATASTSDTVIELDSVVSFRVGDLIELKGSSSEFKKVISIDESANTITVSALVNNYTTADSVEIPGFTIQTYLKSTNGLVNEVEQGLGVLICSTEPEVTEFYYENVHEQNKYVAPVSLDSASTLGDRIIDSDASVVYLTSGADGTSPSTEAQWTFMLSAFDNKPIRMIGNCETTDVATQKAGEVYCSGRDDKPIWITNIAEDQTKAQLQDIGSQYQRGGIVPQVGVADWIEISDSFNTAPNAPARVIPNLGHVMGTWIYSIATQGIHKIPSTQQVPIVSLLGLANSNIADADDRDRTDIDEYGVNIIQRTESGGFIIRNFYTFSTGQADRYGNAPVMRNFFKISFQDSLIANGAENQPSSAARINENKQAMLNFFYSNWFKGSNGRVPLGETFGQFQKTDGTFSTPDEHFSVQADAINNPLSEIRVGNQNYEPYFTIPTPAGSIEVAVGILVL